MGALLYVRGTGGGRSQDDSLMLDHGIHRYDGHFTEKMTTFGCAVVPLSIHYTAAIWIWRSETVPAFRWKLKHHQDPSEITSQVYQSTWTKTSRLRHNHLKLSHSYIDNKDQRTAIGWCWCWRKPDAARGVGWRQPGCSTLSEFCYDSYSRM